MNTQPDYSIFQSHPGTKATVIDLTDQEVKFEMRTVPSHERKFPNPRVKRGKEYVYATLVFQIK